MKRFRRRARGYQCVMEEFEVGLMLSLCGQFIDLLSPPDEGVYDPDDEQEAFGDLAERDDPLLDGAGFLPGEDHADPADPDDEAYDPFALWEQELDAHRPEAQRPTDPVLLRLFPDAYRDDPKAAEEFRRYTEPDQRQRKIEDTLVVMAGLDASERGGRPVRVEVAEVDAWLRTLTALRLVVAERLGISAEHPAGDPEAVMPEARDFMAEVYEWLGFVQESLLRAL